MSFRFHFISCVCGFIIFLGTCFANLSGYDPEFIGNNIEIGIYFDIGLDFISTGFVSDGTIIPQSDEWKSDDSFDWYMWGQLDVLNISFLPEDMPFRIDDLTLGEMYTLSFDFSIDDVCNWYPQEKLGFGLYEVVIEYVYDPDTETVNETLSYEPIWLWNDTRFNDQPDGKNVKSCVCLSVCCSDCIRI